MESKAEEKTLLHFEDYLGFSYFKIFFRKTFILKNFIISLIIISVIFIPIVSLMPTTYYFASVLIIIFFSITFILYSQIFFTFRSSHYYNSLKNKTKYFDLKIYINLFFVILIYSILIFITLFFLSGIFSILNWGLNYPQYTDKIFTGSYNWSVWQWGMIIYQFILILIISFAICLFCQQLFNNKKVFNIVLIFIILYISINIVINCMGLFIWENNYTLRYDEELTTFNTIYLNNPSKNVYFDSTTNTIYFYPVCNEDVTFFQGFSLLTNPFYSCGQFISLATSAKIFNEEYWLSIGGTLDGLTFVIDGYEVAYEDLNIDFDFKSYNDFGYSAPTFLFTFWISYIWIFIFVLGAFIIKIFSK